MRNIGVREVELNQIDFAIKNFMNLCMLMMMVEGASKYQNAHNLPSFIPHHRRRCFDGACESQLNFILLQNQYSACHISVDIEEKQKTSSFAMPLSHI